MLRDEAAAASRIKEMRRQLTASLKDDFQGHIDRDIRAHRQARPEENRTGVPNHQTVNPTTGIDWVMWPRGRQAITLTASAGLVGSLPQLTAPARSPTSRLVHGGIPSRPGLWQMNHV